MRSYVLHILNKEDVRPYETPFKLNGAFASLDNLRSPSGEPPCPLRLRYLF